MVDIRLARPDDAPAIARVHVAVWETTYRGLIDDALIDEVAFAQRAAMWSDILTAYTETHPVLVAEDFGVGVCGFGNAGPLRGEDVLGYSGEFKTLYLLPAYQRRGIGRRDAVAAGGAARRARPRFGARLGAGQQPGVRLLRSDGRRALRAARRRG